jgi:methionyl-tRNA synthetase
MKETLKKCQELFEQILENGTFYDNIIDLSVHEDNFVSGEDIEERMAMLVEEIKELGKYCEKCGNSGGPLFSCESCNYVGY